MALKKAKLREILSKAGVDNEHLSEAVDEITEGHLTSINALQEEIATLKEQNGTLTEQVKDFDKVQKELDDLKSSNENDPYKVKYEAVKEEFDNYKADIQRKEIAENKQKAYSKLLENCNIDRKRISAILKVTKLDDLELDENGNFKTADELSENIKTEWADFVVTNGVKGANTQIPPANTSGAVSKEEIKNIKDPVARHRAMAANPELFGLTKKEG